MSRRIIAVLVALVGAAATLAPTTARADDRGQYGISLQLVTQDPEGIPFLGENVTLKGRVTYGPRAGRSVTLYQRNTATWKRIGTARLTSRGAFSRAVRLRDGGNHRFRAVISASRDYHGNSITSGLLPVYRYVDGTELTGRATAPLTIGGQEWEAGTGLHDGESLTYPLAGKTCLFADLSIGLVDGVGASQSGAAIIDVGGSRYSTVQPERGRYPIGADALLSLDPAQPFDGDVVITADLADPTDVLGVLDPSFVCNVPR